MNKLVLVNNKPVLFNNYSYVEKGVLLDGTLYSNSMFLDYTNVLVATDEDLETLKTVVQDEPEQEEVIPNCITPRQIRLQLSALDLRQAVEDWIATQSINIKDWWEFSLSYERNNQMLIDAATHFGLTSEQLDQLFIEASKL